MEINIKRWDNENVIFSYSCKNNTIGKTVEKAIKHGISLAYADLCGVNLSALNLLNANLSYANLNDCNLSYSYLNNANLTGIGLFNANLYSASLYNANLANADLSNANLYSVNLYNANLSNANLKNANLIYTMLRHANLTNAILDGANLKLAILDNANPLNVDFTNAKGINNQCPKEGSFIGWKKCNSFDDKGIINNKYIVKLEIPADAKRCSGTGIKCRSNKAKVLEIQNFDGTIADIAIVYSHHNQDFPYKVGEIVYPDSFDDRFWLECSHGIHFFMKREDAVNYCY